MWIPNSREDQVEAVRLARFASVRHACVTFMYGLELIGRQNTPWRTTSLFLACGSVLGAACDLHFRRARAPLIEFIFT